MLGKTIANIHKTTEPISLTKKLLILFIHKIEQSFCT